MKQGVVIIINYTIRFKIGARNRIALYLLASKMFTGPTINLCKVLRFFFTIFWTECYSNSTASWSNYKNQTRCKHYSNYSNYTNYISWKSTPTTLSNSYSYYSSTPATQTKASTPTTSIFARHFDEYFSFLRWCSHRTSTNFILRQI